MEASWFWRFPACGGLGKSWRLIQLFRVASPNCLCREQDPYTWEWLLPFIWGTLGSNGALFTLTLVLACFPRASLPWCCGICREAVPPRAKENRPGRVQQARCSTQTCTALPVGAQRGRTSAPSPARELQG